MYKKINKESLASYLWSYSGNTKMKGIKKPNFEDIWKALKWKGINETSDWRHLEYYNKRESMDIEMDMELTL